MNVFRAGVLAIAAALLAPGHTVLAAAQTSAAAIDAAVQDEMRREHVPGVAVAVLRGTRVIRARGYGLANVENEVLVTPATLFQSGSVGKQFTAAVLMLQVEAGRLSLDDPITRFLPDAPAAWRAITVRHLLNHTSGIADYADEPNGNGLIDMRRDYTENELVRAAYRAPLQFTPGSRWHYSNTGYLLLGAIIRRVSGEFYGDVLRERIFGPLGMKTARIISESDIVRHRAAGYRLVDGELKNQEWVAPSLNTTADGSLYVSLNDMIAWDRALRSSAILRPESWRAIYTPARLASGASYPYGFGWFVDEWRGRPWLHHSGSWQGFKTYISRYLGADLTVIVLANLAEADPARFVDRIAAALEPDAPRIEAEDPIADAQPELAARARVFLGKLAQGEISPEDRATLLPGSASVAAEDAKRLASLGSLQSLTLVDRRPLGDEVASTYLAHYGRHTFRLEWAVGPAGELREYALTPERGD